MSKVESNENMVSVIIPVYNGKRFLKETIKTVQEQTYKNWEIIAVDDNSSDNSVDILKGMNEPRMRVFKFGKNHGGPSKAKNEGIGQAKGKYIAFLDQDDLWDKDKLERQVRYLEKNTEVTMVASNVMIMAEDGEEEMKPVWPSPEIWERVDLKERLSHENIILTSSSVVVRRDFFDKNGLFKEQLKIADDYEMWYRVARLGKIYLMPEKLTKWRCHSGNISMRAQTTREDMVRYYEVLAEEKGLSKEERAVAGENLEKAKVRLANFYLVIGREEEANRLYDEMGESGMVRMVKAFYKLSPSLAKGLVKLKMSWSEFFEKRRVKEVNFP